MSQGNPYRDSYQSRMNMNPIRISAAALALAALLAASPALAWWNGDWSSRQSVTLDAGAKGANLKADLENVPVLIRLHSGNFDFLSANPDGSDLRFVAGDDKTPLKFYIEKFDPVNQLAVIWVQVPKLAAGKANTIWLYSGNDKAAAAGDAKAVFDAHQIAVYDFAQAGLPKDVTANANNASASSASQDANAIIGAGARFNGSQDIQVPASASLGIPSGGQFTWSAWIKPAAAGQNAVLLSRGDLSVGLDAAGVYAKQGAVTLQAPLGSGGWHQVALTAGPAGYTLYVDGTAAATAPGSVAALSVPLTLGANAQGSEGYQGDMDEVELSNVARPADWIALAAKGQGPESAFIQVGQAQSSDSGGEASYFGTILRSVTLDGWVVIGLLAVMSAISWVVMVSKGLVIGRMQKDNERFMASFRQLAANPGALDRDEAGDEGDAQVSEFSKALFGQHDHYQSSPIYRIYHVGVQELKHRFGTADPRQLANKTLTPQAIDAIRAALDGSLVRENQKINSLMVLLTIAISGGPFLGLLGTVVGVMITFAAIAATGDVNVNAIAPGIAAALVATVAGLAVAIPALFGYNYLVSRAKDISADMHVFVDEFIGRIAETYAATVQAAPQLAAVRNH